MSENRDYVVCHKAQLRWLHVSEAAGHLYGLCEYLRGLFSGISDEEQKEMASDIICRTGEEEETLNYYGEELLALGYLFSSVGQHLLNEVSAIEERKKLPTMPYREYLKTDHWIKTRQQARDYFKGKCCLCGKTKKLHVHHKSYENRGNETMDDLILLCSDCHAKFHDKLAE